MKQLVGLVCLLFSTTSLAETLYIRDTLYLPLRAEPLDASELIRKGLKSGTPLESLDALTTTATAGFVLKKTMATWWKVTFRINIL